MNRIATLFAAFQLLALGAPVQAQDMGGEYGSTRTLATERWVEEWDPATGQWVRVADEANSTIVAQQPAATVSTYTVNGVAVPQPRAAARYAQPVAAPSASSVIAQYGPFVVTSATEAAMVGSTDVSSPAYFDAMLRDFPAIERLDMIEAPGTSNDIANLAVGRRIREAGIATHVPNGGSVRSGAVELFLAGKERTLEEGAQFAVHSWLDNHGREADDFAADHPAHRLYLDYYIEMGMTESQARDFYAMTNSVPHHSALWLGASDMRPWLQDWRAPAARIAKADSVDVIYSANEPVLAFVESQLPVIAIGEVEMSVPVVKAPEPALDYRDLSGISLAQLDISRSYAP